MMIVIFRLGTLVRATVVTILLTVLIVVSAAGHSQSGRTTAPVVSPVAETTEPPVAP